MQGIRLRGSAIQYLHLHRIPFLDVHGVRAILNSTPNLRKLGIYRCELLHFGSTKELVDIVGEVNVNRPENAEKISFDFFPRHHYGPAGQRSGSCGVIWRDECRIDTIRAIVAHLIFLVPYAFFKGIDLVTPGKGFRLWLDKIPFRLGTLEHILEAILNLDDFRSNREQNSHPHKRLLSRSVLADLVIATTGNPLPTLETDALRCIECAGCSEDLPVVFFTQTMNLRRNGQEICHGCELKHYLDRELDHMLEAKRLVPAALWRHGERQHIAELFSKRGGKKDLVKALGQAEQIDKDVVNLETVKVPQAKQDVQMLREAKHHCTTTQQSRETNDELWRKENELHTYMVQLAACQMGGGWRPNGPPAGFQAANWDERKRKYHMEVMQENGWADEQAHLW